MRNCGVKNANLTPKGQQQQQQRQHTTTTKNTQQIQRKYYILKCLQYESNLSEFGSDIFVKS